MDGETFLIDPNAVVVLGVRSVLSMVGLTTAVVGYWMMERQWDNYGAAVLRRRVAEQAAGSNHNADSNKDKIVKGEAPDDESPSNYVAIPDPPSQVPKGRNAENEASSSFAAAEMMLCGQVFHESGCRDFVRVGTFDSQDPKYHPPKAAAAEDPEGLSATAAQYYNAEPTAEFQARLETAFPLPKVLLAGTSLWSLSFFLDPNFGGFRLYFNVWNVMMFLLAACVGPILAFPMRQATLQRDADRKKKATWALASDFLLIAAFSIGDWMVQNKKIWYIPIFGGKKDLCLALLKDHSIRSVAPNIFLFSSLFHFGILSHLPACTTNGCLLGHGRQSEEQLGNLRSKLGDTTASFGCRFVLDWHQCCVDGRLEPNVSSNLDYRLEKLVCLLGGFAFDCASAHGSGFCI
jgi:hypothetical protein